MKNFLAIYIGTHEASEKSGWNQLSEAERGKRAQAGIHAWGQWMQKHAAAVVVQGGPLGKTKLTDAKGVSDTRNAMTGFVVVRAESHEAAARMFEGHPHFSIFPGQGVEIMECLPIPGQ